MRATLLAAAAVAALSLSGAPPGERLELVDGTLSLTNSRNGGPLFSASNLAPGHATSGTVTIANAGTLPGELTLTQGAPSGALAGQLDLVVRDLSRGSTVYAGRLSGLARVSLGRLAAGASRAYSFSASLAASAGNSGQGRAATVAYTWTATEARALRRPLRVRVRVPARQRVARSGRLLAYARCNQACWLTGRATARGRRGRLVRTGRVRANREKRLVLRVAAWSLRALRQRRSPVRVTVTVRARTASGAHKSVRKTVRAAVARPR